MDNKPGDEVLYLLHGTDMEPGYMRRNALVPSEGFGDQFPGVYLSLITRDNLETQTLYGGKYYVLYSASLLEQRNYHINIHDHNGIISEHNTYYPWNLGAAMAEMKRFPDSKNEVVFHDPIPPNYIVRIVKKPKDAYMYNRGDYLPTERLVSRKKPDLSLLPFYVYPMEHTYTGIALPYKKSSIAWMRKMAKVARIPMDKKTSSREELIDAIRHRMHYLHKHRDKQDLSLMNQ